MNGAVFLIALAAAGADAAEEQQWQADVARLAPAKARMFELRAEAPAAAKGALHEAPLLRWSNPTVGSVYGEVYLWTVDGRPAAIASIFRWHHPYQDATVEFTSLWEGPLTALEGDAMRWEAQTPGVAHRMLDDVRPPSSSPVLRLTQMKALARQFSAELLDERGGDAVERQLRLLNQPVHRYEAPKHDIVDGAIFAFVEGTDPEAWLLLEAVQKDENPAWRFALARMNSDALQIRRRTAVVQSWPAIIEPWRDRRAPYLLFTFDPNLVPLKAKESP